MKSEDVWEALGCERLIAVLTLSSVSQVEPLMDALARGGINAVELTLRTDIALDAMKKMRGIGGDILLGAGTVLTPDQVLQARDAGADFAVAPGCNPRVLKAAQEAGLPFGPGITTASEIEAALEFDCRTLKFFPAEPSGGIPYLSSMSAPYRHLNLRFIPLGGIHQDNLSAYARSPLVCAIGGSWIAPSDLIDAGEWSVITQRARRAREIIQEYQP